MTGRVAYDLGGGVEETCYHDAAKTGLYATTAEDEVVRGNTSWMILHARPQAGLPARIRRSVF
ncbi:MAG: hypothetical protein OXI37_09775 [Gammaproteobacteria bacterium]|nr:hypothetical protein [Gammaproteobacteria bacterium]